MKNFFNKLLFGLFYEETGSRISSTKVWNGFGILVVAGLLIYTSVAKEPLEWLVWAFIAMVTPAKLVNNLIALRFGKHIPPKSDEDVK